MRPASFAQAFRAADLVLGSEGFAFAVLDLVGAGGAAWRRGGGAAAGDSRAPWQGGAGSPASRAVARSLADDRVLLDVTAWNRLARRAESCEVALVVCTERPMAGAAASLGLEARVSAPTWRQAAPEAPLTLEGAAVEIAVRHRKGGQAGFVGAVPCLAIAP